MGFSGFAQASIEPEWEEAQESSCHHLLTDLECRAHLAQLVRLPVGGERTHYLAQHSVLLEERVQACGCSPMHNTAGVLRKR